MRLLEIIRAWWFLACCPAVLLAAGCQSTPEWMNYGPFAATDRTTYTTPAMRTDAIRDFAAQADGTDSQAQRDLTDQLARQIQIEQDPLVRKAIVDTLAEFRTQLAQQVLTAGLNDVEPMVRMACCRALGRQAEVSSVSALAQALHSDEDLDVRLEAAEALGQIRAPEAVVALRVALDDADPALQYAGVQSLKSITGRDLGGDVQAWRQLAAGEEPIPIETAPSVADRIRNLSPF